MFESINPPIRPNGELYAKRLPPQNSVWRAYVAAIVPPSDIRIPAILFEAGLAKRPPRAVPACTVKAVPATDAADNVGRVGDAAQVPRGSVARRLLAVLRRCIEALFRRERHHGFAVFNAPTPDIRACVLAGPVPPCEVDRFGKALASPYAKYEVPPGHRQHTHDLLNTHRGLNEDYHVPRGLDHTQAARREFFALRRSLLKDADEFLAGRLELPETPKLSLPAHATASDMLRCGLEEGEGILVGECHSSAESKKLLMDNMAMLAANGVGVLYLEHVLSDLHQHALDAYNSGQGMPEVLSNYLEGQDRGHHTDPNYSFRKLVEAAHDHGIAIVAIDCLASYEIKGIYTPPNLRGRMFSYFAQAVIRHHQGKTDPARGHKWIALVGNTHTNTYQGVPGLAELTGAIGLRIAVSKNKKEVDVDLGAELGGGLRGSGFVKAHYVLNLPPVERSRSAL
jgi:hypothetical protein